MKIKDVEKLTGLTAKSIRYYESKGLLKVERDEDNSYRNYTEENVSELKRIKVYRYLDFSIEEIRNLLNKESDELKKLLKERAEEFTEQSEELSIKRKICMSLSKDGASSDDAIDEYEEIIQLMDEDGKNALEAIKDLRCPTLTETIAITLIFLGPIMWLFVNIHEKRWDSLMINSVIAIIGSAIIEFKWQRYILAKKNNPKRVKKVEKDNRYDVVTMIIGVIISSVLFVGVCIFAESAFAPQGWLFYEKPGWSEYMMFFCILIPGIYIANGLLEFYRQKKNAKKGEDITTDFQKPFWLIRKGWFIIVPIWLIMLYLSIANAYYVTEHQIIHCTTFCPWGKTYEYQDVSGIQAGFGQKTWSFQRYNRKGNFYYKIVVDGKTLVFSQPSVNDDIEKYENDTYLELEEFDQALMKLGIPKEGDDKGYQSMDLDKVYVERFRRIISNR